MSKYKVSAIYYSRDRFFKNPTGPVTQDEPVFFQLLISSDAAPSQVCLIVIDDEDNSKATYPMKVIAKDAVPTFGYEGFTLSISFPKNGLYWYYFLCRKNDDVFYVGKNNENNRPVVTDSPMAWQQTVYTKTYKDPEWIHGGIFYHIFVDRFNKKGPLPAPGYNQIVREDWGGVPNYLPNSQGIIQNNDFFGGNLPGIIEKLPYLENLGVTCLYLSPLFEANSNHKYDTADYMSVDPMFGTEEDFAQLCKDADSRGIKVICDGVFSHTGSHSIYFNKDGYYNTVGAWQSASSPYRDWYYFYDGGCYETWWGIDTLPRTNKEETTYVDFITGCDGVVAKWLAAGAHGWRLDVADELPNSFMEKLTKAAKTARPDALLIGEVWEDASSKIAYGKRKHYLNGEQLDSVMNYPLRDAIIRFVRYGSAGPLRQTVELLVEHYPAHILNQLMNMLGNHDTMRILTALGGQELSENATREEKAATRMSQEELLKGISRLKIATVLQMTLPGVPCIYYGDEVGMEGYEDPFNRACFPWEAENLELASWFKKIISIRKGIPIFRKGDYRTIKAQKGVFAFQRSDGNQQVLVAANCSRSESLIYTGTAWHDLLSDRKTEGNFTIFPGEVLLMKAQKDDWNI